MRLRTTLLGLALICTPFARATIIGLNQIVTPDLQPKGVLNVSAQAQDAAIGNQSEVQFELGLTDWVELAYFQGVKPGEGVFSTEASLWTSGPQLLSAGAINLSTRHYGPQPVVEYGYYTNKNHYVAGAIYANRKTEALLGYRRSLTEKVQLALDFQSGSENYATIGFTYVISPSWQVNPAIYLPNGRPRILRGYLVVTWTGTLWK